MADQSQVGEARRFVAVICAEMEFSETRKGRAGVIVTELGSNLVKYAVDGRLIFRRAASKEESSLEVLAVDCGPGLNVDEVMRDGFTTGDTPGTGLGAARRMADEFDIYSQPGKGTVVVAVLHAADRNRRRPAPKFEVGALSVPMDGESVCGDAWCAHQAGDNFSMILADGLGHGPLANEAAVQAVSAFEESLSRPLAEVLEITHQRLRSTRGAAVFLLSTSGGRVEFTGAGNVRALIQTVGRTKSLLSQNGTAGLQIRTVKVEKAEWDGSGYLILYSDGITNRCDLSGYRGLFMKHPAILAAVISRDFSRGNDDSTVVVVRWRN